MNRKIAFVLTVTVLILTSILLSFLSTSIRSSLPIIALNSTGFWSTTTLTNLNLGLTAVYTGILVVAAIYTIMYGLMRRSKKRPDFYRDLEYY